MFLGCRLGNCPLCCAHASNGSPGGASCCTGTGTWKTADHLLLQQDGTPEAGTRLGARAQPSLCDRLFGKVTASTLRGKIKVQGFYRKSPPLLENFYGWTEVEHLQGGREQRSSAEPQITTDGSTSVRETGGKEKEQRGNNRKKSKGEKKHHKAE